MWASWLWLASLLGVVWATAVTPMEKVRELLANLKKEIEEEAVVEAENYAEFERWCDLEAQQCANDIAGAKTRIEEHGSNIDEAKAGITRLGYEMEKLALQVSHKEEDLSKSTGLREKEHAEFVEVYDTLQHSIDVLDKALEVLSKAVSKETLLQAQHALSFVLRQANAASDASQSNKMQAFFQQVAVEPQANPQTFLVQNKQPVQGAVYEGHSDQVKSVIQQMKDDIVEQQRTASKDEETKAHAFDMYKQSMENELKGLQKQIENNRMQDAAFNQKIAEEEQARTDAQTFLEKTEQYLVDTKTNCEEKARQWEIRTKGRQDEMNAIDEATKVLSSDRAEEMKKHERGSSLSQIDPEVQIPSFLQVGRSRSVKSSALSFLQVQRGGSADALTERMVHAMQADPFGKVKKMIESMVVKLLEEQAQEQEHKAWCDAETAKTTKQEKYHARNSRKFNSRIEEMNAEISQLQEGISDRSKDLDAMTAAFAEATKIREAEKQEATTALKDYADAQQMLQKAVQVLTDFYQKRRAAAASAAASASLIQQQQGTADGLGSGAAPPQTFEGTDAAAGREGAAQNILNILEISLSDFTKLESETQTEEEAAQKEYETYMQEYKVQKAVAEKEREHFTIDLAKVQDDLKTTTKDLAEVDKELKAAREYLDELKTTCDFSGPSYEERQARREAELKSLQNALAIISGEAIP